MENLQSQDPSTSPMVCDIGRHTQKPQTTRIQPCGHTNVDSHEYKHKTPLTVTPRPSHPRAVLPHMKSRVHGHMCSTAHTHLHSHVPLRPALSKTRPVLSLRAQRGVLGQVPPPPPTPAWPDGGGCQAPGELSITANPPADRREH